MSILADMSARYGATHEAWKAQGLKFPGLKYVEPSASNFGTGFRLSKPAAAIAVGGVLAYSAVKSAYDIGQAKKERIMSGAQDVGNLAAMNYDAGSKNLGATGDLVFGLHNKRRG